MSRSDADKVFDVFILEGIEDHFSLFSLLDEPQRFQHPHLMGDGRIGDADELGNIKDAEFFFQKSQNNFQPGGVAENLECLRKAPDAFFLQDGFAC